MLVLDALFDHFQQISSNVEIIGSLVQCSPISAIDVRVGSRAAPLAGPSGRPHSPQLRKERRARPNPARARSGHGLRNFGALPKVIECTALAVGRSAVRRWITERRSIP